MVVLLGECSQCGTVLLNLSSLLQRPTISRNSAAIAGNEACLPKVWLQSPEIVTPVSLDRFPDNPFLSHHKTQMLFYIILTGINSHLQTIWKWEPSVFNGVLPCIIWRWDPMRWWASIPESKGLWCLQEIQKPINGAFMLRLGSYDLEGSRFVWMVIEHGG